MSGPPCKLASRARGFARVARFHALSRQGQKAVQLREQQGADVELGDETAARDQASELCGRHQFNRHARFRLESLDAFAGLDEEIMNAVVEAPGAWRVLTQGMDGARSQSGLFEQLAATGVSRSFSGIEQACRQFP